MDYRFSERMSTMRGSAIREIFKFAADPEVISLAGGNPAPELFPNEELADIAAGLLRDKPVLSLQYGVTEGYAPLREAVRERLKRIEHIDNAEDDVVIVSGGQQGIELSIKALLNEGDAVIVEEPSFIGALNAFRSYNARLVGVRMDEDGMDIAALEQAIKTHENVRMIYTIPTFQNPMGTTMSLEKRRAVYDLARRYNLIIIEDNPYGDLAFDGIRVPTIKSMDTDGRVIYCGSFSKILAPGLRVGFLCANRAIVQKVVVGKQVSDVHTAMLPQLLAYEYMMRYDLDAAIVKMRANYAHKCAVMLDAIERCFPVGVAHTQPRGGLFVWCDLGHGIDTQALAATCAARKVVYVPGCTFMVDMDAPCSTLRLNYSTMDDERLEEGVRRLGAIFGEVI